MSAENEQPLSSASMSSARSQTSTRTSRAGPSTIRTVVTAPPWARDEPPSPKEGEEDFDDSIRRMSESRPHQIASRDSSSTANEPGPSRWWPASKHRLTDSTGPLTVDVPRNGYSRVGRGDRTRSLAWLTIPRQKLDENSPTAGRRKDSTYEVVQSSRTQEHPLHLDLPPPSADPHTLSHNFTPGWDTPWTPRPRGQSVSFNTSSGGAPERPSGEYHYDSEKEGISIWKARRRRARKYLIHNPYVPLLFRFMNIVFTTAALALAIRIRYIEKKNGIYGAIGSSPSLLIIFAPLTLIHVIVALHAEYFGRPVGLWRTSGKLAWTLVEVVFICAWSAELALCFDNYFSSLIPCSSYSTISWYDELPRPTLPALAAIKDGPGRVICGDQVALIFVIGFGLIVYCFCLVISLFRIFERVKHLPTTIMQS